MSIAIICRYPHDKINLSEWLNNVKEPVFLFTNNNVADTYPDSLFRGKFVYDKYFSDYSLEYDIANLNKEYPINTLITYEETDIIRASIIRENLKIKGQGLKSAQAFRDKALMKDYVQKSGYKTPKFKRVDSTFDLMTFADENGFPLFIKPIDGMAALNTNKINSYGDLKKWLKENKPNNFIIETYIEGDVFHTDGIISDGELLFFTAFEYFNTTFSASDKDGMGDILINKTSQDYDEFLRYTKNILNALPTPSNCTFHLEFFRNNKGELILCEAACRTSGALVPQIVERACGISLHRESTMIHVEKDYYINPSINNKTLYGAFYKPLKNGLLEKSVKEIPFEYVVEQYIHGKEGESYNPSAYFHTYVEYIIEAPDRDTLLKRFNEVDCFIDNNTDWKIENNR
ncbi:ATP-grasp domain-containing protein [Aquibacillus salsiterrae]|uniref:ATP-grasp domain-containing protein n=1 Tax=Aquibacillus salsiterrae TaxID=2950439 RepID=A0A9X4AE08_9BACI|nr:hypothetical protein [Aquibacillus salsiterrae]MDC3416212.1 hypothetical protein [Aquibacillus salsiterrae]